MQRRNRAESSGRSSFSGKPKVLIVDRSPVDGRVLEELLRPMAEVNVKCNVWTAVKFIDSDGKRLSAIFVEARLLRSSSIADHWIGLIPERKCPRIIVVYDEPRDSACENLNRLGVVGSLRKPYDRSVLMRKLRDLSLLA